ncbi:efflux RND transporter periplasmic adaptor subunit [Maribacter sp. IgM3_T14_3]|uniref:efflux RND transporter periplasmic adaptor subunit n=1 Tax=Maribacter sp. IgM3_T14_3 TaxID=3415140 RepID=UPI003C6FD014
MKLPFILISLILLVSCGEKSAETEEIIRAIKYEKVELSSGIESHTFSGVAIAQNETNLSFKVAGTLASINVKLGEKVRKGQLIATIDPSDYKIQSNQAVSQNEGAVANAKAAEAQLISAKSTYDRITKLYENNSVALSEYQQVKASMDAAQAQYDAAKSQINTTNQQLKAAGNQVGYTRLVAPMAGVITAVQVEANEIANAGMLIAKVSSLDRPEVEVSVPEVFINKLKLGQQATIKFPSFPELEFKAAVEEIAFASEKSTTYKVILRLMSPADEIRPGMAAEVDFILNSYQGTSKNEIIAPIKAVASGTDGNYVFKLIPEGENRVYIAKRIAIELGDISMGGYIIKKGLSEGDLVAVAGLRALYDGKKVKLLEN